MSSLQHSEVSVVLIPLQTRKQATCSSLYKLKSRSFWLSSPTHVLTHCVMPNSHPWSHWQHSENDRLILDPVHLFYLLTSAELSARLSKGPFIRNGARLTKDYQAMAWKPQDESPALGEEEGAISQQPMGSPMTTKPERKVEAGEVAMPSCDQGISTSSGLHSNNEI